MTAPSIAPPSRDAVLSTLEAILRALVAPSVRDIELDSSLMADLCLDSLQFVDLMGSIESELGIAEFPMQSWVDTESERNGKRFTVAALLDACMHELAAARPGGLRT